MPAVQLFAYDIDTHDPSAINAALRARGADPSEMNQGDYFRLQANLQRDLIASHVAPAITPGVLPVFMAPEFFFKWRDGLPYDRAALFNNLDYLAGISAAFPQVLWIAGTVWWHEPRKDGLALVHNTALIYQNGHLLHSWQKQRLSQIDGLRHGPEIWDRRDLEAARILEETQDPFFDAAVPGGGTLTCGIEICLDHLTLNGHPAANGVLRTVYQRDHPDRDQGAGVDLHLLSAAGMQIQPHNIVARSGGVMLRCDGGAAASPRSQAVGIRRAGANPARALRYWTPIMAGAPVRHHVGAHRNNRLTVFDPVAVTPRMAAVTAAAI